MQVAEKQIDAAAFEQAFQEALPGYAEKMLAKAKEKHEAMGMQFSLTGDIAGTFCQWWPKVRGFINMAVTLLGWFQPAVAAAVKATVAAIDKMFIPMICPTTPPAALPTLTTNVKQGR